MKIIQDEKLLHENFEQLHIYFQKNPPVIRLVEYKKGELINGPLKPLDQFLILLKGSAVIYDLTEEGVVRYIAKADDTTLLGDMEFSGVQRQLFFCEAREKVICLSIPFQDNQSVLENDPLFLRFILRQLAEKLAMSAVMDVTVQTLEEKVLLYLRKIQLNHEISSVTQALQPLHCSRRQLQRVLKKLCDEGLIIKTGRGTYKLK